MLISVVIPLFNKADYVLRAVRSVLNQSYSDFELIVVDDGSTDGGAELIESLEDSHINLFKQPNRGVAAARNAGVQKSTGNWVAFLDADDEYLPEFLKEVVAFIEAHRGENLSMVSTGCWREKDGCEKVETRFSYGIHDYFDLFRNQCSPCHSSSTVVKKVSFLEGGGFPEGVEHFEDWNVWFKMGFIGKLGFVDSLLSFCHYVEGSTSRKEIKPLDLYNNAITLPMTVDHSIACFEHSKGLERKAWRCVDEILINIGASLARKGAKSLACKTVARIRWRYFSIGQRGRVSGLFFHMVVPQPLKRIYWHYMESVVKV